MKAKELKEKYLKKDMRDKVGVVELIGDWYHIHDNEDVPEDKDVAFHVRR